MMDSHVGRSSHPQDLTKLKEGERVEVRQKDVGLRGSWHLGTIVGVKSGRRVVEYDELLTDDGSSKLRESIPCAKLIEKPVSSPGVYTPRKKSALQAACARSLSKRRGFLRPSPPVCAEPSPLTWKGGLFVDVFYQDAWWEAVLLNDVTSLDGDGLVDVIYPDEGDLARVNAKDLRISQFWDEVTGKWSIKGSIDLPRFLKRRGIAPKEVSLMAGPQSLCNTQNSCTHGEMILCDDDLIQTRPSRNGGCIAGPSSVKEVNDEPLLFDSHLHVAPGTDNPHVASSILSTDNPHLVPGNISTDKSITQKLPLTCTQNGVTRHVSSVSNVCLETSVSPDKNGQAAYGDAQSINGGSMFHSNEKNDLEKMIERECLPSPSAVKEESILCFKRRRIDDGRAISYDREALFSRSHPIPSSPLQNHCPPQNHQLESSKLIWEEPCFVTEQSPDRAIISYSSILNDRGPSNFEGSSKWDSANVTQEDALQQSLKSEGNDLLRKGKSSLFPGVVYRGKKKKKNSEKGKISNAGLSKSNKLFMLALEAPVRKSQKEYERITLAGTAALGGGVPKRLVRLAAVRPARKVGKDASFRKPQEQSGHVNPVRKAALEEIVCERVVRPAMQAGREASLGKRHVQYDRSKGEPAVEVGVHGRAGRAARQIRKEVPLLKSQESKQIALVGKAALDGGVDKRVIMPRKLVGKDTPRGKSLEKDKRIVSAMSVGVVSERARSGRPAYAEILIQKSAEQSDKPILAAETPLEGVVHERLTRRGRPAGVKALGWKSGESRDLVTSPKAGDVRKRVMKFGEHGKEFPRSVDNVEKRGRKDTLKAFKERLLRQKQADTLKRKASKMSCLTDLDGKSAKMLKVSRSAREPDQGEAATSSELPGREDKGLKGLARKIGIKAILEAGCTIEYRPRRGTLASDAVYTTPRGSSHWSLPNVWHALRKEERKGQTRVEKVVVQQVFSKIENDEKFRSAFEKLDRFSGTCLQDVMRKSNFTYGELTEILLEDLGVLKKPMPVRRKGFPDEGEMQKKGRGKAMYSKQSLSTISAVVKSRGRKRKQDLEKQLQKCTGKPKTWHSGAKKAKASSLIKALTSRNNARGSSRSNGTDAGMSRQESQKRKENAQKPRSGFRLEVRPSNSSTDDESEESSSRSTRTVASWMIARGAVLEKERIFFVDKLSNETLKEGLLTREGILCRCCKKVYTIRKFEEHGGNQEKATTCGGDLVFTSGRSFLDCQLEAWKVENRMRKTQDYKGVTAEDSNDDTCLLCGDGGSLLCCDLCPSTFHASCLQLDNVPEGNWYCPKCRCGVCRGRDGCEQEVSMAVCRQCEHRYHIACLCGGHTIVENNFFCGQLCEKIYSGLRKIIGIDHFLERGLSWTLLRCMEEGDGLATTDVKLTTEVNSKLAVALLVLKECFNPMDDPRTNVDMITHALYNRWSQFDRLNYVGFYTAVLEKDDEIISVASIRVHGARVAEMPLIGTRHKYRRQGMCRLLVGAIEKLLCSLEVGTFILPAIPELFETWTQAFGFKVLDSMQKCNIKDLSMMLFPGTDLLQKPMLESVRENRPMLQNRDSAAELPKSMYAISLEGSQQVENAFIRMPDTDTDLLPSAQTEFSRAEGTSAQISDAEALPNDDKDDEIFFDACLNLHSTDTKS